MKSFYFNIRAVALINVVCSDQKAQINECASPQPTTHPAQQVFPFLSADDKTASSQMPPRHDRAAPLLHLIGNKIPLFSMSGLKHVYTSVAQWQVMAGDTQGLHTANKQERNMVSVCGGAAQTNTGNYKVPWKMMTFFFSYCLPQLSRHSLVWRHLSAQLANLHFGPACSSGSHARMAQPATASDPFARRFSRFPECNCNNKGKLCTSR